MARSDNSSTASKRKTRADSSSSGRQPTISQLFHSAESKQRATTNSQEFSTNGKKRKLSNPNGNDSQPPSTPPLPASTDNMYSFSNSNANGDGIIDLTKSSPPNGSPRMRRVSGGAGMGGMKSISPNSGPKKLTVRNMRTKPAPDVNNFTTEAIKDLDTCLTTVFKEEEPKTSNEEMYRSTENVCRLGKAPELAKLLQERCDAYVAKELKQSVLSKAGPNDMDVLRAVLDAWSLWRVQLLAVRQIFFYLDRTHLLKRGEPSIEQSAFTQFRTHIFSDPHLNRRIIEGACKLLSADRTGVSPNQALFKDCIDMFHKLGVYTSDFEPRMLALSQAYISTWADKMIVETSLPEYVAGAVKLMESEMNRCEEFKLDTTTQRDLLALLENHLIERQEPELTNQDSIADLLDINATESLQQLFSLLQRRRLGEKLKSPFGQWVDDTGTDIVFDEKQQDQMIIRLLAFKQQLDNIWRVSFQKNEVLGHALRESFENFINKSKKTSSTWNTDNSKPGEMIAKYVDALLKAGSKAIPTNLVAGGKGSNDADDEVDDDAAVDEDSEVNNQLDQVLDLFRFVHGKAVFEAFYKKDFARRLLMGRSASYDAERSMLARLKTECGAGFTQNLEQMFKDMELTREEMGAYKTRTGDTKTDGPDLNVNILAASAWPSYADVPVIIPADIKRILDSFENYYYMKHSGRKLSWKHAMAHCQLKAKFPKGTKEIVVSAFQAVVLLQFNGIPENQHLSYEHLKAESGLSDVEVKRTLQSLACAKLRPLTKHPRGREISETDTFTFNGSFSHERYRLKINTIQLKETKEENKQTHERVAADRQFETQAAIVRIMKSRKLITHAELVAETISATRSRGVLPVADIKKNIDKLIEKEYMERAENNSYSYLA